MALSIAVLIFAGFMEKKMNLNSPSYVMILVVLTLHNLYLYGNTYFGIRFDVILHFIGGITIAMITDRLFFEKMPLGKKFCSS